MLRFFRRLRHRLLFQNRFSKYLLYAMGEILLVVIGILIALQVDNWNETRQMEAEAERQRKELILALYGDLEVEIRNLEDAVKTFSSHYKNAIHLMEVIETKSEKGLDTVNLFLLVDTLIKEAKVARKLNTFDGLVSSGRLKALQNDTLAGLLLDYYAAYDYQIASHEDEQDHDLLNLFIESFDSEDLIKINALPTSSHTGIKMKNWLANEEFYKMIAASGAQGGAFSNFFRGVKSQAENIIEYIKGNYAEIILSP